MIQREFWKDRAVFVTGGTGFLGGWVIRRLLELEARVVALVRDGIPGSMFFGEELSSRVTSVFGKLEDPNLLRRSFAEYGIDTVFHLAAQPLVGVAKLDPIGTLEANVVGTWNVLEGARQAKVRQVVVASSDKAYGDSDALPYTEQHPLQGKYPYDCSKSCADLISQMYLATYGLPVSVIRCANLFGGGDLNFSRTIPGAIKATLEGKPFVIRSDGQFVRDFLYVKDAADCYLFLAQSVQESAPQGAYNFSLEVQWTVLDCARAVLSLMGRADLEPVILNQASAEIREQYMSCAKAREVLKWRPAYNMTEALEETIQWYRRFLATSSDKDVLAGVAAV
jgi:CDP-glucose 4,6-dehydratase